jgi:hypothetical protein
VRPKDCEGGECFRDDVDGANVRIVDDANDTSAHDVQDEGESLRRSAESIISRRRDAKCGVKYDLLFRNYCRLQVQECTNIRKYSEKGNMKDMKQKTKIRNRKHEESNENTIGTRKEKEIK